MSRFNISNYIVENRESEFHAKRIVCEDGFNISVQAGKYHYCRPRSNEGPWITVECGFPSEKVPELMQWIDDEGDPTRTVYGYVPVEVVTKLVMAHGGLKVTTKEKPRSRKKKTSDFNPMGLEI